MTENSSSKEFSVILLTLLFSSYTLYAGYSLSGYAKSLDFALRKSDNDSYRGLSGNRLRLDGEWQNRGETLEAKLVSDHEFLYGSLLASRRALVNTDVNPDELLQMNWALNEKENLVWRHNLYRAWGRARLEKFDLTLGRQRIAWGQGRIWNPSDTINPYNPLSVEREERAGSDLAHLRWNASELAFVEAVYVPRRKAEWTRSLFLGRARVNYKEMDWGVMGGKRENESWVGADHAAQVFEGSLRSELAYTFDSPVRRNFARGVVSYDYNFSFRRPLYLLGEFFYNGIGEENKADYRNVILKPGDQQFFGKEYFGFGTTWDATPLLKLECYGIVNLSDGSVYLGPRLRWQPVADLELGLGYQVFQGKEASEFGGIEEVGFISAQWFFSVAKSHPM